MSASLYACASLTSVEMSAPSYLESFVSMNFSTKVRARMACAFSASSGQSFFISPASTPMT